MTQSLNRVPRILLVDDEPDMQHFLTVWAARMGLELEIVAASDIQEGLDRLNESCFDAAIIDVILPGVMGVQLGEQLRAHDPHIPLAYFTNLDTPTVRQEAEKHHAYYLYKPKYLGTSEGMTNLLNSINMMAHLNPCLEGGVRIDNQGFQRKLPTTPIVLPEQFETILKNTRARVAGMAA